MSRLLITITCAIFAILLGSAAMAETIPAKLGAATDASDVSVNPIKALGRVFFSESGWHSPADQHLIVRVYERRVEVAAPRRIKRLSYSEQILWIAKRYSTGTFAPSEVASISGGEKPRSIRQIWISGMGPNCLEPEGWPIVKRNGKPFPPWKVYESRCQRLFKRARSFIKRKKIGTCQSSMPVDHWGGPMDDWRAERNGWLRVDWSCVEGGERYEPQNRAWCDPNLSKCRNEIGYVERAISAR